MVVVESGLRFGLIVFFQAKSPSTAAASAYHNSTPQADGAQESRDLVVKHS